MIGQKDFAKLAKAAEELSSRVEDELHGELFLYIPSNSLGYYSGQDLFGKAVSDKFPNAKEDIESAGKCLAVGQYTACVFHLMRAMEGSVSALSANLSIPNPEREWGKLLSDIHTEIEKMAKGQTRDSWSESHANLYHVKQAWRNKTMHPKSTYTGEQAKEVFQAVRVFMSHLATLV